jgi:hypothetical protein
MADAFDDQQPGLNSPASKLTAITPDDSNDLANICRALYVGSGGNVAVIAAGDSVAVTIPSVPSGAILPIRVKRLMLSNTTAGSFIAMR